MVAAAPGEAEAPGRVVEPDRVVVAAGPAAAPGRGEVRGLIQASDKWEARAPRDPTRMSTGLRRDRALTPIGRPPVPAAASSRRLADQAIWRPVPRRGPAGRRRPAEHVPAATSHLVREVETSHVPAAVAPPAWREALAQVPAPAAFLPRGPIWGAILARAPAALELRDQARAPTLAATRGQAQEARELLAPEHAHRLGTSVTSLASRNQFGPVQEGAALISRGLVIWPVDLAAALESAIDRALVTAQALVTVLELVIVPALAIIPARALVKTVEESSAPTAPGSRESGPISATMTSFIIAPSGRRSATTR